MCAAYYDDEFYDRSEADGQAREAEGENVTETFYPNWTPESFAATGLRAELRILDGLIDEIVRAA